MHVLLLSRNRYKYRLQCKPQQRLHRILYVFVFAARFLINLIATQYFCVTRRRKTRLGELWSYIQALLSLPEAIAAVLLRGRLSKWVLNLFIRCGEFIISLFWSLNPTRRGERETFAQFVIIILFLILLSVPKCNPPVAHGYRFLISARTTGHIQSSSLSSD